MLGEDEALLLRSEHEFIDTTLITLLTQNGDVEAKPNGDENARPNNVRIAGDTWMIYGPCECVCHLICPS